METNTDTIHLLKECDSGAKMAVSSIDEVVEDIQNSKLKEFLLQSKKHHKKLEDEIHEQLMEHDSEEKDPNPIAKGMSWLKTNMKMTLSPDDRNDATVADLIIDGCHMGIKSLHRFLNQYHDADSASKNLCHELIRIEEQLCNSLCSYL